MTQSVPLELASSADLNQIFAKIELGARRCQVSRCFELSVAELRLGDPRLAKLLEGTAPVCEAPVKVSASVKQLAPATQPVPVMQTAPSTVATAEPPVQIRAVRGRSKRCPCGTCMRCLDNARIFNDKFADQTYYKRITVRHNSTLGYSR